MTCSRVQNLLSAYIDKELSKEDYFKIRTHLTTCSICNKAFEELMDVKELFDDLETIEPPQDMWINIRTTILTGDLIEVQNTSQRRPWWNIAFNFMKVIIPAAVIGIIVAVPIVSEITGLNIAEIFFKNQNTVNETITNGTQTVAQDDAIAPRTTSSSKGAYTPASDGIFSNSSYGLPMDLGESTLNMSQDSFYLGHDNNGVFNDIVTFFSSIYGLTIEVEITQ